MPTPYRFAGLALSLSFSISFVFSSESLAICLQPPGDVTGNGVADVADVQCNVISNLWSLAGQIGEVPTCLGAPANPSLVVDHNCDSVINVADTILGVQFALQLNLSPQIDSDANRCVDACETDGDGDGDFDLEDCAPQNPAIHHGADELCNGYDDDCDGDTDESVAPTVAASCASTNACETDGICPAPPAATSLVITEIQHSPDAVGDSVGEWFELYNGGATPINVQGWLISDGDGETHTINAGGALFVPARGHLVLGRSKDFALNGGVRVNYVYDTVSFDGAADSLVLLDSLGAERARVDYALAAGYPLSVGRSLALRAPWMAPSAVSSWRASENLLPSGDYGTPAGPNVDAYPVACLAGDPVTCDDGNPCTDDSCDQAAGCVTSFNSSPCGNTDPCSVTAVCDNGACVGGQPLDCSDNNVCTADSCHPALGCLHQPVFGDCEDGNICTILDTCLNGTCFTGIPKVCDDFLACTADSCDPAVGCVHAQQSGACEDGNVCTELDVCVGGSCVAGIPKVCDDGSTCTVDACHPILGCIYQAVSGSCSDGEPCTQNDTCVSGNCVPGTLIQCNDGNPCTTDSCHGTLGCLTVNNTNPCDDGNPCTVGDACGGGSCLPGAAPLNCDDGNPCTEDSCLPATGCDFAPVPDGDSCGDGDGFACSINRCTSGICTATWLEPKIFSDIAGTFEDILRVEDGYILVGYINVSPGVKDVLVMKTDLLGNTLWLDQVDSSSNEVGLELKATPSGGFVFTATPYDRLIEYDAGGNLLSDTYSDTQATFWGVDVYPDGSKVAAGWTSNTFGTGQDMWIVKKAPNGVTLWSKKYDYGISDRAFDVVALDDGGALVVGYAIPVVNDVNGYVIRLDSNGIKTWEKFYNSGTYSAFSAIERTSDGGFILGGRRQTSTSKKLDMWLVKYDAALNEVFSLNRGGNQNDDAQDVMEMLDGSYVGVGQYQTTNTFGVIQQRFYVHKVNSAGAYQWEYIHNPPGGWANGLTSMGSEGGIAVAAWLFSPTPVLFFMEDDGTICQ